MLVNLLVSGLVLRVRSSRGSMTNLRFLDTLLLFTILLVASKRDVPGWFGVQQRVGSIRVTSMLHNMLVVLKLLHVFNDLNVKTRVTRLSALVLMELSHVERLIFFGTVQINFNYLCCNACTRVSRKLKTKQNGQIAGKLATRRAAGCFVS